MEPGTAQTSQRLDKWLWCARFFKTRSGAAKQVSGGHVRVNGARVTKPATAIKPGDVMTFVQGRDVKVVKMVAVATRRGPAPEAQALYEDQSPPPEMRAERVGPRPTKKARRDLTDLQNDIWHDS